MCGQNFYVWPKFRFLTKRFYCCPNFRFLTKMLSNFSTTYFVTWNAWIDKIGNCTERQRPGQSKKTSGDRKTIKVRENISMKMQLTDHFDHCRMATNCTLLTGVTFLYEKFLFCTKNSFFVPKIPFLYEQFLFVPKIPFLYEQFLFCTKNSFFVRTIPFLYQKFVFCTKKCFFLPKILSKKVLLKSKIRFEISKKKTKNSIKVKENPSTRM